MGDYEPLDITRAANAPLALLGDLPPVLTGDRLFQGIPFRVGPPPAPCFIHLGEGAPAQSVSLALGQAPCWVLFAHRLLRSELLAGGPLGVHVADYVFCFDDETQVRVPIRERFEIGVLPVAWGQLPFAAWPDQKDSRPPRFEGRFEHAGTRLTEVNQASPRWYYLWAWRTPQPTKLLTRICFEAKGPPFLVAAVTLGYSDEHPFGQGTRQDVRVTLTRPEDASPPFVLNVEVDRGVATYPYAVGLQTTEAYLDDPLRGWGEPVNPGNSPAYVQIAAVPSATVTVKKGQESVGSVRWGLLQDRGKVRPNDRLCLELVDHGRNWVHVTVLDDATGKPVPCRVHFRSPAGVPYAPHGHHAHVVGNLGSWHLDVGGDVRLGQASYAYIDGRCQGWLPRGEVLVDVARGYEYLPLRARVHIEPGQRELVLRLKRIADFRGERWFSGDTHVHFLSTQGCHLEASGEDLAVVNLLQSQWGHLFTSTEEFAGRPSVSPDGQTIVYAAQENRQHILGHLTLLGLREPVMPWCSGGPGEAELGGGVETTVARWADACHAQGGTVIIPHLPNPNCEPALLVCTGRADALEMAAHGEYQHLEYYRYLNNGYRLPLVGGTDKMSSEVPVGLYRTYVFIPPDEGFTYEAWCRNLRLGRTFVSSGPLLRFSVEGRTVGDTLPLPARGGTVSVEAEATSVFPIHSLQIVQDGRVVAQANDAAGSHRLVLRERLRVTRHSWLAARCGAADYFAPTLHHDCWRRGVMAHTSPVYVACGGEWTMFDPAATQYMLTLVQGGLEYLRQAAPLDRPGQTTHHHGASDHQAFLEEPFLGALEVLHKRLHQKGIKH